MKKERFEIGRIPSVLWGKPAGRLIVAVHGNMSNKEDVPIKILAEIALPKGYQVLSFDLPGHGDRNDGKLPFQFRYCTEDLRAVIRYAKQKWSRISLFANSIGAYFSLASCPDEPFETAWFLSPVVDMERTVENMMAAFGVTAERLEKERAVHTPVGQDLYWDDYCYMKKHPIARWDASTYILYGGKDTMCEPDTILGFAEKFSCGLQIVEGAEHYFYTPGELRALKEWLGQTLG
ncbi:alpha/beta hydrolase [Christensenella intestinihominis]|uniref:alpha/beta hydrolase n=1 Tax=Christensenella intestinihominis TaxID=1851429 RepID=UPI000834A805|nr:alpha/beta fold hydrolase [Christensenella intestinihominis]